MSESNGHGHELSEFAAFIALLRDHTEGRESLASQARELKTALESQLSQLNAFLQSIAPAEPKRASRPRRNQKPGRPGLEVESVVRKFGPGKVSELAQRAGIDVPTLAVRLRAAAKSGVIRKTGVNRGTVYSALTI